MNVLVTGAAGFIGFHLVKALLARGDSVVGIDNINDYYDINLKYARLKECGIERGSVSESTRSGSSNNNYTFQKTDIVNFSALQKLFEEGSFDYVFHMAAQPGVRYSLENPRAYIQANIVGFANILECCRHHKCKHLVYASSSSVYGMNENTPFSEDDRVDYPVSLYAATKKSNELLAHTYSHLYQLPTTGLRFFTVYGPWGRPDMAPMIFAKAIYEGKAIKVFNHGNMLRDFTYIDDIIEGVLKAASKIPDKCNQRPYYQLLNIGNSQPVQLIDFIREMEKLIGAKAILDFCPMQAGDVPHTFADTSRLHLLTGYKPSTSLKRGLVKFIRWFESYRSDLV